MPATPTMVAMGQSTPPRMRGSTALSAANPTTMREEGMAWLGGSPTPYTSAGTAMMEPPAPTRPSTAPIRRPSGRASTAPIQRPDARR